MTNRSALRPPSRAIQMISGSNRPANPLLALALVWLIACVLALAGSEPIDEQGRQSPDWTDAGADGAVSIENVAGGLIILSVEYRDLDGDNDAFPDTGETGRLVLTVVNIGGPDSDVTIRLTSVDPDVACITDSYLKLDSMPGDTVLTLGSLDPLEPGFSFTTSNTLQTPPSPAPLARLDFCLELTQRRINQNIGVPTCFSLFADVDVPVGEAQTFTLGSDGLSGTADDGTMMESFDIDKDGDGDFTVGDTFLRTVAPGIYRGTCSNAPATFCVDANDCPAGSPAPVCYSGFYLSGSATGEDLNTVAGVPCGGFEEPV